MLTFDLPYPPTLNHYKTVGRTITTKNGKTYQQKVNSNATKLFYYEAWLVIKGLKAVKQIPMPLAGDIELQVYVYPPDKRKRDLDNIMKVLGDSLVKGGLLVDDSQISRLIVERCEIIPKGKVILKIEVLNESHSRTNEKES